MKSVLKRIMAFSSVFIFLFITGQVPNAFSSGENGVDSIRGQWNILVSGVESLQNSPLSIFVNDLVFRPESNDFVAAGCMETMVSGGIAPLSLRATPIGPNDFEVTILSTVEPTDNQPFVIRLIGTIRAYGSGLPDDTAGGNVFSQLSQTGSWEGYHKNRQRKNCPPAQIPPLQFRVDVSAQPTFAGANIVSNPTWLDSDGTVVAAAMKVRAPDGEVIIVEPYTDIFSPQIDFISRFRFAKLVNKAPIFGVYTFDLLDATGNVIPGTTRTDTFTQCRLNGGPKSLSAVFENNDIRLSWVGPSTVPGFDPINNVGFYDIVSSMNGTKYASNLITHNYHYIPWANFEEGSHGSPSGYDYGLSLSELPDGTYVVFVMAHAVPAPTDQGNGLECNAYDTNELFYFTKNNGLFTFP